MSQWRDVDSTVTELTRRIAAMESQSIANKSAFVDQNFQEGFVARLEEIEAKYAAEQKEKDVLVARNAALEAENAKLAYRVNILLKSAFPEDQN